MARRAGGMRPSGLRLRLLRGLRIATLSRRRRQEWAGACAARRAALCCRIPSTHVEGLRSGSRSASGARRPVAGVCSVCHERYMSESLTDVAGPRARRRPSLLTDMHTTVHASRAARYVRAPNSCPAGDMGGKRRNTSTYSPPCLLPWALSIWWISHSTEPHAVPAVHAEQGTVLARPSGPHLAERVMPETRPARQHASTQAVRHGTFARRPARPNFDRGRTQRRAYRLRTCTISRITNSVSSNFQLPCAPSGHQPALAHPLRQPVSAGVGRRQQQQ